MSKRKERLTVTVDPVLARQSDVIDAALVLLAEDGDSIVTSDPDDIEQLALASGLDLELIAV